MHPRRGLRARGATRFILPLCGLLLTAACSRPPGDDSAEAGFARDMATHHAQAVEMGFVIRDLTTDAPLRALAADIIVTQSAQRGMFMSWLQTWGLPQASAGPRMAWMTSSSADTAHTAPSETGTTAAHDMPGMAGMPMPMQPRGTTGLPLMAGMASEAELDALRHAAGRDAEVRFLQLMIRHHEGGVLMARALLARSHVANVVTLVNGIEQGQLGEIRTMTEMLRDRQAEPLPTLLER